MIRSVFLDFYNTLVTFDPPREQLQVRACLEYGIEVNPAAIPRGYWAADDFMSRENARIPIHKRSQDESQQFWAEYEATILREAGTEVSNELALRVFTRLRQLDRKLVLFSDVMPTLDMLRSRGMVLGLVSNLNRRLESYIEDLGLTSCIDFSLASSEIDSEKPHAPIFLAALKHAGVSAAEAIHVGDQYYSDVLGAQAVGISPLLLDRYGFWEGITDCPRIKSLSEVANYM